MSDTEKNKAPTASGGLTPGGSPVCKCHGRWNCPEPQQAEPACGSLVQKGTRGHLWWRKPLMFRVRCEVTAEWSKGAAAPCSRGCGRLFEAAEESWEGDTDWGASDRGWYEHGVAQVWYAVVPADESRTGADA